MSPFRLPEPERVALAVDALCVGTPTPVLIHAEVDPTGGPPLDPFALFCTPLQELHGLDETIEVLSGVTVPGGWRLAGLCAPTVVRVPHGAVDRERRHDAWIVHVVSDAGGSASRLSVPDALELSGPMDVIGPEHPLERCLRRLIGIGKPNADVGG